VEAKPEDKDNILLIIMICYIYIVLFSTQMLYMEGGISSTTTNVQHPSE